MVFHVVATDHEFKIVAKLLHVLICRTYQLIPTHVSVLVLRSKLVVHVTGCQLVGEINVGVVGEL